jgi:RNA polymerase sigma-70 factor (ECF subfamily)
MAPKTEATATIEDVIRARVAEGDLAAAATEALRAYGGELRAYLLATHRNAEDADEVFALVCERVWRGIAGFGFESSVRTWTYAIARNASSNYRRDARVRGRRVTRLDTSDELSALIDHARSETRPYLRTEAKDKLAAIRASLDDDDRDLLVLRVDRGLEWKDLARAMSDAPLSDEEAKRAAQRLRKRFQLLKQRLVDLGKREGLIGD